MAKRKNKRSGIMGRSDIPYAQRISMQQRRDIVISREHAAKIAMFCNSVAMHELEGIGYKRLVRFSVVFKELIDEFYEDPELAMGRAMRRLEQMGRPISGELYTKKIEGATVRMQEVKDNAMEAAQIALIVGSIAMHEVFGFGQERQDRIAQRTEELTARYAREGEGFLLKEMEKIGFPVVNGTVVAYMDDDGNAVTPSIAIREGYHE